jgi:protein TonB
MALTGLRRYLKGSVPISIGLHLLALFLIFGIPLTANLVLPIITVELPDYVRLAPLPPPPAVAVATPRRSTEPTPARSIPTVAPMGITPEVEPPSYAPPGALDATSGLPPGGDALGALIERPAVVPPPPPPKQSGPVRVADLPVPPRKIVDARPVYPDIARQARREGTVVMEAVLDTAGRVTQLRVIQSVPLLDQAALDAVRQWRYTPTTLGGHPVSVLMTITVRFTLQ